VVGAAGGVRPDWPGGRPRWLTAGLEWTVVPHPGPTGTVVRRAPFREIGGFGRRAADLPLRLHAVTGGRWRHVPDAVVRHEMPAGATSFPAFVRRCAILGRPVLRPMPEAVLGNLTAALHGPGAGHTSRADHILRAGAALAALAATGAGLIGQLARRRPRAIGMPRDLVRAARPSAES
jgi:hypothetical protein